MTDISDILRENYQELDEINKRYQVTFLTFLTDVGFFLAGVIITSFAFFKLTGITDQLSSSLSQYVANEETILSNMDKIALTLGSYSILETEYWGFLAAGLALVGLGQAWYMYRTSSRNAQRVNEININFPSALSRINYRMLSSLEEEVKRLRRTRRLSRLLSRRQY